MLHFFFLVKPPKNDLSYKLENIKYNKFSFKKTFRVSLQAWVVLGLSVQRAVRWTVKWFLFLISLKKRETINTGITDSGNRHANRIVYTINFNTMLHLLRSAVLTTDSSWVKQTGCSVKIITEVIRIGYCAVFDQQVIKK